MRFFVVCICAFAVIGTIIGAAWAAPASAAEPGSISIQSPDGRNAITLTAPTGPEAAVAFSVTRDGRQVIDPSPLGPVLTPQGALGKGARVVDVTRSDFDERFELPWGKTATVRDRHVLGRVTFETPAGLRWVVELRAYDDGVAFRYLLPEQKGLVEVEVREEITQFRLAGDGASALFSGYDNFTSSHEALFERKPLAEIPAKKLLEMPLLITWPDGQAAAIAEGRVRHFPGMYLQRASDDDPTLRARLSPLPGRPDVCFTGKTPCESPWRVILLADDAGRMLESNLLVCLNDPPPAELGDFAWARPGKTTFHWWNGDFEEMHKDPKAGAELARHKEYIDFCAKHGIAYHSVTGDGRPWYVQKEPGYAPPQADADILTPRPDLKLPEIIAYAKERGVRIRLWVHWASLEGDKLEQAFSKYEDWGIAGLMVDFLDRDDQQMNDFSEEILRCAARHHLHIQIHGSPKYSGEQRTFPNLFNREGVLNLEYLKWGDECTPAHAVNVAYTRALAGPVDFHLGGFRAVSRAEFKPRDLAPVVMGTRCHQLALYVVFENPMPMVADTPGAYEGQPGFEFIAEVPTTWGETRFLAGEPGEYVVLARRKGDAWYLAGITNWTAREVAVPLECLGAGQFAAKLYVDGSLDEARPNEATVREQDVAASESLKISLAPGGGFVAVVRPR